MSSGRVKLAATGIQDSVLNGNPDVTYFIKKFTRYTKFAIEVLDIKFIQTSIDFGSWVNVVIPRNGQLIRTIYVKLVLPPLSIGGYTNSIGNAIIEHADLVIGGNTIERINGEYMQIYNQTFISDSQQNALEYMINAPGTASSSKTLIVPLSFYFMENNALAIPLCALTRQEVEIRIKFRPFTEVVADGYLPRDVSTPGIPPITWATALTTVVSTLNSITWLPYSFLFAVIQQSSSTNIIYYSETAVFNNLSVISGSFGIITCIAQNDSGLTLILAYNSLYNIAISQYGPSGTFTFNNVGSYNFTFVASNGTNFLALTDTNLIVEITANALSYNAVASTIIAVSLSWSPSLNAFIIGSATGMWSYKIGGLATAIPNVTGPYATYSPVYGQIYNISPVAASNTVISNVYQSSIDGGITWTSTAPAGTTSIAYGPSFDIFFSLQDVADTYSIGTPNVVNVPTLPAPLSTLQASLPVEYVFLADEEVKYIQSKKIDYVITQLQLAEVSLPVGTNVLNAYRLYFINPVKELFFVIQESSVLVTNDYFNYYNSSGVTPFIDIPFDNSAVDIIGNSVVTIVGSLTYTSSVNGADFVNTPGGVAVNYVTGTWSGSPNFKVTGKFLTPTISPTTQVIFAYSSSFYICISPSGYIQLYIGPTAISTTTQVVANVQYTFSAIFQTDALCYFYIDNALIGTYVNTITLPNSTYFFIGTMDYTSLTAFNGSINDISIYNTISSAVTNQLINLKLQFNGEVYISRTVADTLYLGTIQFFNNHTRVPDMPIYNYSFSLDPENHLPTGQVNMSQIINQNLWMWLSPGEVVRNIRVYAVSYNILRVKDGVAAALFMDNNFI